MELTHLYHGMVIDWFWPYYTCTMEWTLTHLYYGMNIDWFGLNIVTHDSALHLGMALGKNGGSNQSMY